ncbi:MAG: transglycosylase SLT domain-containing protein [Gemmatimonadota bacterium]
MLAPERRQAFDVGEAKFHDLNTVAEQKYSLPEGWLAAMEWQESGFNPRAYRIERQRREDGVMVPIVSPDGRPLTGVGLLQITNPGLKGRLTDAALFDPATNIDVGARYVAFLRDKYGDDFPKVSAAYNAGSVRPDAGNPWNMHQYGAHVSSEVSALNYYIERRNEQHQHELVYLADTATAERFDLAGLIDWEGRATRETDPAPAPEDPREADTNPDVALPPRREGEA